MVKDRKARLKWVRSYQKEEARRVLICQPVEADSSINSINKGHGRKIEF